MVRAREYDRDPFDVLDEEMGRDRLVASREEITALGDLATQDRLSLATQRYAQLRRFAPAFLEAFEVDAPASPMEKTRPDNGGKPPLNSFHSDAARPRPRTHRKTSPFANEFRDTLSVMQCKSPSCCYRSKSSSVRCRVSQVAQPSIETPRVVLVSGAWENGQD